MAKPTPDDVIEQIIRQNDENYGEDSEVGGSEGGAEPLDIDKAMESVTGEEPRLNESVNIAGKIDEDEIGRESIPPMGADVPKDDNE